MQKQFRNASLLLAIALAATTLTGCASSTIDATKYDAIVDVRTPMEFAEGHLQGAINVDVEDPSFIINIEQLSKTGDYILYCHSGNRAGVALGAMQQDGFTGEIVNAGGYEEASAATGLPLVTN
jgi:rhodanese-related sulfurtransferase